MIAPRLIEGRTGFEREHDAACCDGRQAKDWASDAKSFALLWGLPVVAMMIGIALPPIARTPIWAGALLWMGMACVMNARRCGRTHCRFTGPFFIAMAALVVGYGTGLLPLGHHGWAMLGVGSVLGNALIWWGSERLLGRFSDSMK